MLRAAHGTEYLLASSGPIFLAEESGMKKILTGSVCVALIGAATLAAAVYSQEKKDSPAPPNIMHFGDLKWTPIIRGCGLATGAGDPTSEGTPFVGLLRCVDGAKIPAHSQPTEEIVTVSKEATLPRPCA